MNYEKRQRVWEQVLERGWVRQNGPVGFNALLSPGPGPKRLRLVFKEEVLELQEKRVLTPAERLVDPHHTAKWFVVDSASYEKVVVGDRGLSFDHSEKVPAVKPKPIPKTTTAKTKTEKGKE